MTDVAKRGRKCAALCSRVPLKRDRTDSNAISVQSVTKLISLALNVHMLSYASLSVGREVH